MLQNDHRRIWTWILVNGPSDADRGGILILLLAGWFCAFLGLCMFFETMMLFLCFSKLLLVDWFVDVWTLGKPSIDG